MKLSISFLSIKEDIEKNIKLIDNSSTDFIHLDIMDGKFVNNKTIDNVEIIKLTKNLKKPLDVHLMVKDVKKYVDELEILKPTYITFHVEAVDDVIETINYIKNKNIQAGLSLKPNTNIKELIKYFPYIDLILVMSVEPGMGGQLFIQNSIDRINELQKYKNNNEFLIEVDGGINNETIKNINADIVVVGSFITSSNDYEKQIKLLNL